MDDNDHEGSVDTRLNYHEKEIKRNRRMATENREDISTNSEKISKTRSEVSENDGDIESLEEHLTRLETAFDDRLSNLEKLSMYAKGALFVILSILSFVAALMLVVLPHFL